MQALFIQEYNKFKWQKWEYQSGKFKELKKAKPAIPPKHGVYIIRCSSPLPRVQGLSNVIYIGQSGGGKRKGKQGIGPGYGGPGRLFNRRGLDEWIREKIEELYPNRTFIVECYFTSHNEDPEKIENSLIQTYLKTYYELPPANHTR